jgi:thiamine-phosphate pyrophosphorylase
LERTARLLPARRGLRKALPPLQFFTDPARTPDPVAVARRLPRGSGVVLRTFGAADAEAQARALKAVARTRGLKLLIGQDAVLARRIGADGVHLPERLAHQAGPLRRGRRDWIVTAAAHSRRAVLAADADAVVVSPAFLSRSPSAGTPLGPLRLARLARGRAAYALGGVDNKTARRLIDAGLIGLAAVEGLQP